jgi:hypothetical protein
MVPVADEMLAKMAPTKTVTADTRQAIHERLPLGAPEIADIAKELAMSIRTLARSLEKEGIPSARSSTTSGARSRSIASLTPTPPFASSLTNSDTRT